MVNVHFDFFSANFSPTDSVTFKKCPKPSVLILFVIKAFRVEYRHRFAVTNTKFSIEFLPFLLL